MKDQNKSSNSKDFYIQALAKRITFLREQKGVSQDQLAKDCGLHPQNIKRMEEGVINPAVEFLVYIANGLGVPLKELFTE